MIEKMIDNGERILYKGKPHKFLYILGNPLLYVIAIFWAIFDFGFFIIFKDIARESFFGTFGLMFLGFHMFPVWIAIFSPIYRAFNYHTIEYVITDRRVYICSGIFGRDVRIIEHRNIENLSVNINFIENIFKVGTIILTPGSQIYQETGNRLRGNNFVAVEKPYEVYKLLKKVSLDVTTDQQFPNALRPDENPGYKTRLKDYD